LNKKILTFAIAPDNTQIDTVSKQGFIQVINISGSYHIKQLTEGFHFQPFVNFARQD